MVYIIIIDNIINIITYSTSTRLSFQDFLIRFDSVEVCKVHKGDSWFAQSYPCYFNQHVNLSNQSKSSQAYIPTDAAIAFLVYNMTLVENTWLYLYCKFPSLISLSVSIIIIIIITIN